MIERTRWRPAELLPIPSGRIQIADPLLLFDGACVVDIPPGAYIVEADVLTGPDGRRVAAIRVLSEPSTQRGAAIGWVGVDAGQVAILEASTPDDFRQYDPDHGRQWLHRLAALGLAGVVPYGQNLDRGMIVVRTGLGASSYAVRELLLDEERVGVEIVFVNEYAPDSEEQLD
jgi:hypothetical protein